MDEPRRAPHPASGALRGQDAQLSTDEISRYVALDQPLDCAGSFKWESLGITLFEAMRTDDPTALEGLPLIALSELLREAGVSLPLAAQSAQN